MAPLQKSTAAGITSNLCAAGPQGCAPSEAPLEESRNVVVVMIALIAPRSGSGWNPGGRLIGPALIQVT